MRINYDLHIHSCLSPCGDEDMTPNNIVNMSCLLGLEMIAVADHNTAANVRAVCKAAEGKITVVPAIEVTTAEEVHTLCYFTDVDAAEDMGAYLKKHMMGIKNRPEIFGRQLIMDENDEIVGEETELLVSAVDLDIYKVQKAAVERGGIFVPAHINRSGYSLLANLGFLPPDLPVDGIEISESGLEKYYSEYEKYGVITNSDAHYLENISEPIRYFDKEGKKAQKIFEFLSNF